ncbi:type VI secretion system baseplate subunit TssG [Brenneria tiliae]|uniref:Type VI secretion system baseplate subunit TssG n=1 Tax=Brenneria tiliae TaxID=2914984 RepID=A0ABT0MZ82_9GAMM|nr:type VI secretion system baseplate subunit TssG [Brenneria tiliae]MCL2894499.1 type VI secretion system baseplate subunit TssG [Brenneria tiliae]MCL2897390.1 type VI secretion system baseplate subunit TssG [Brenneria tiliae]MCL2901667.1 type VI secretion system baseplate subunit TssG [Brenneria tiliae]
MSETLPACTPIRRLTPLSETFWDAVMTAPWRYDLFQLLRRLDAQGGERYLLGRAPLPRFEPLRIGQKPSMAFAPSTIAEVSSRDNSPLHDVAILSFGLFGPNGPLPLHMTEYARERIYHHQDDSLSAFADLFHHRLTLLFYRAWADAQPTVSLDREDDKRFERYLASLIGMGQPGQMEKGGLSHHARYALAGHLSRHGRDAEGLEKILRHYFQVPVRLVENVAQWMSLTAGEQARLGAGRRVPRLGKSAFLGVAVRDAQHKFRLELGPLDLETYRRFVPGGAWVSELRDWIRQYLGIEYLWEVRLILHQEAVCGAALGDSAPLGYATWLGHQPQPAPRGDLVFSVER